MESMSDMGDVTTTTNRPLQTLFLPWAYQPNSQNKRLVAGLGSIVGHPSVATSVRVNP
jgi:hypothetical protein